jgi:uncharacterized membrane protein (DUF485 family)
MNQTLINITLALTASELIQDTIEAQQVRKKVSWLKSALHGVSYKDRLPFKIDSRLKSYAISLLGLIGFTALAYPVFWLLDLSATKAFVLIIAQLLVSYWVTAILLDKYHVEIGTLTEAVQKDA